MTEEAWLSLTKLAPLRAHVTRQPQGRRGPLFLCACCRLAHDWELPPLEEKAILATERFADGEITRPTWQKYRRPLEAGRRDPMTEWERYFRDAVITLFYYGAHWRVPDMLTRAVGAVGSAEYAEAFEAKLCAALRDIYGNPFRPVAFDPMWRTDTAQALAKAMYESRDFSGMPILADALQDAGCDSDDILTHCRDANRVHVRGCWVVDRVLGKGEVA